MRLELKQAIGASIRSYRLKRNIPQESLGPSQPYISNLEAGRGSASLDKIEQMADVRMRPAKSSIEPRRAKTWCALKFKWAPVLAF